MDYIALFFSIHNLFQKVTYRDVDFSSNFALYMRGKWSLRSGCLGIVSTRTASGTLIKYEHSVANHMGHSAAASISECKGPRTHLLPGDFKTETKSFNVTPFLCRVRHVNVRKTRTAGGLQF